MQFQMFNYVQNLIISDYHDVLEKRLYCIAFNFHINQGVYRHELICVFLSLFISLKSCFDAKIYVNSKICSEK